MKTKETMSGIRLHKTRYAKVESCTFYPKSNQKQFKEFNPELFKAYINKFSDKDKLKALEIVLLSQSKLIDPDLSVEILNYCKE